MAKVREQRHAATRAKILEAAKTCFAEVGYERATIREIARVAGMSTGAVFGNFADKEALYQAIHGHKPITPELGAGLLNVVRRAIDQNAQPFDRAMASGLVAQISET